MTPDERDKRLAIFVLPVIVLFFYITAALHFSYTPDDTYIYMQFAKNIAHGGGFSFNYGEPTYGITGVLWMMIIASANLFNIDPYIAAKALDLVAACGALTLFYYLTFEIIRDGYVALFATLAFSMNVWFLRWAGTGMETSFAVLLVLTIAWFCIRNEYFLSLFFTALFTLVRPEGWLLVPLIMIDVYINSVDKRRALKLISGFLIVFIALILPWMVYAYHTFGAIFPNTMFAKSNPNFDLVDAGYTFFDFGRTLILSDGVSVIILVFSILFLAMSPKSTDQSDEEREGERFYLFRQSFVPLSWVVLISLLYCLKGVNIISRYLLIVTPFIVIFSYLYFYKIFNQSRWSRYSYVAMMVLSAFIMLQNQVAYNLIVKPGIQVFEQGMDDCLIPIGKWFNRNTPPGTVIFAADVGAIGYYSERPICDAAGLVSPSILEYFRKGYTVERMYQEKLYLQQHAGYIVHRSTDMNALNNDPGLTPVFTRVMYQLELAHPQPMYYTVYKVK
ncbi:MAG: hypothetical protein ACHQQQ_02085 [Bacteroidota bacterium]